MIAFEGTQPVLRQVPPVRARSTSATRTPRPLAAFTAASPAGPAPSTTRSYRSAGFGLRQSRGSGIAAELLQPATAKPRAPQPARDVRAVAHQPPEQLRPMVLDHHHDDALVQPERG